MASKKNDTPADKTAAPAPTGTSGNQSDLITEDEFEDLLDELQGRSGQADATPAGNIADEARAAISLPEQLEIATVSTLREQLPSPTAMEANVALDAQAVTTVDTAALQLLVAFVRDAGVQGIDIQWDNPTETLLEKAQLLDLLKPLGLSGVAAGT